MGRLIAISNRTAVDPRARAGGLAVAVWESLKATGGLWFGWSGDIVDDEPKALRSYHDDGVDFLLTDLTQEEHDGYYLNYASRVIWPVFHYRIDLAWFDRDAFTTYAAVNQRFARHVAPRIGDGDTVWVHDYHFLLMADALRHAGWEGPTGFFLHIPFPAPEVFRTLPEHHWIGRALCAYDVVGFQAEQDRYNFVQYLIDDCDGEDLGDGQVRAFDRTLTVKAYPIGIDAEGFVKAANSERAAEAAARLGQFLGGRELVIGCDRMDYSKGLPQRFEAVGRLFDNFPDTRGKVSVTQITPPSRSKVEEYQELRIELDQLAGRINGDYGDLDWIPLRYLARAYQREELAGLFRIARVGLVTPLRG
ncbi:MAG: trehalose-6-phosphate synthase, partial [Oricola sp.]|nr:trehalose-6-phosphate synthase [Oricola sp.]